MPDTSQVSFCPAESPGFCSCRRRGKWPLEDKQQSLGSCLYGEDVLVSRAVSCCGPVQCISPQEWVLGYYFSTLWNPAHPASSSLPPPQPLLPERGPECACGCGKGWGNNLASREQPFPPWCGSIAATSHHTIQDSGTQHWRCDGLGCVGLDWQRHIWGRVCAWFNLPARPRRSLSVWLLAGSRHRLWSGSNMLALGCELRLWQRWGSALVLWVFTLTLGNTIFLTLSWVFLF